PQPALTWLGRELQKEMLSRLSPNLTACCGNHTAALPQRNSKRNDTPGRPTSPRDPAAAPKMSPGRPFGPGAPGAPDFPVRPGCPCSPGRPFGPLSPLGPVKPINKTGTRHHRAHYKRWEFKS
uniref:Uncharacterized protein n=1 Tax=Cyanistes caeruleus TaxID=156563 RepID=A0A8C0Z8U5_CYACU